MPFLILANQQTVDKKIKGPRSAAKYKKAPDAPKRFKSAFIIFSAEKHKEIKKKLEKEGRPEKTTDIAKLVSESWKSLPPGEREKWEQKAETDRARYEEEKATYKGPWKVPAQNKRSTKDPSAPKRPMSAFLAYSNSRRAGLKRLNPKATNADLSKMLSKTWKELAADERAKYMEEEADLRAKYKQNMAVWRKKAAKQKKLERAEEEERLATEPQVSHQGMNDLQQQQMLQQLQMQQQQQQQQDFVQQNGSMGMEMPQLQDQHAMMDHQRQAMMQGTAGSDSSGLGGDNQQNMGILGGQNPYGFQAMSFPRMGGFGMQGSNSYFANAFGMQPPGGQTGTLSAMMGQNYMQNPTMMGQLQQMQGMNSMQGGVGQLYGQNPVGIGLQIGGNGNGNADQLNSHDAQSQQQHGRIFEG